MKHIALTVVWGSILFAAGEAGACEGHAAKAAEAVPARAEARPEDAVKAPDAGPDAGLDKRPAHAAKCQCGSAADCTCKKGTCECPKCKKPSREQPPVEAEASAGAVHRGPGAADA